MIYISGKITKNKNWERDFRAAENYLNSLGFVSAEIKNPLRLSQKLEQKKNKPTYKDYIDFDLSELFNCDDIYMLWGWWRSKGARLERHYAKVAGLNIVYQSFFDFVKMRGAK